VTLEAVKDRKIGHEPARSVICSGIVAFVTACQSPPELEDAFASLLGQLTGSGAGARREIGTSPTLLKARPRGRN